MRFFAAAIVFFNHFGREAVATWPDWFQECLTHGRSAVTFFFILSGFVLAYSYLDQESKTGIRTSKSRFYLNRFARIYPIYFVALLPALLNKSLGFIQGNVEPSVFWDFPIAASLLQAWIPAWADAWNPPAWSLSVEAFFYLVFPFMALRLRHASIRTILIVVIPLALATAWSRIVIQQTHDPLGAFFPLLHLPTFLLGYGIGRLLRDHPRVFTPSVWPFLATGTITFAVMCLGSNWLSAPATAAILELLFAILIATLIALRGPLKTLLSHRVLVLLGESSYSLYITHMVAMVFAERVANTLGLWETPKESVLFVMLGFAGCVVLSVLLFQYLETPARRYIVARTKLRPATLSKAT